jgi:hypothetical protein
MAGRRSRLRGHVETLPSGNFRAKVYAGIDPLTGKRRYLVETAASEKAANVALTKLQRQVDEEAAALLNAAWVDPEWRLLLWLTMITGPRRGVVSAMR